jgi:hypothetical protein
MIKYAIYGAAILLPLVGHAQGVTGLETNLDTLGGEAYGTSSPTDLLTLIGTVINVLLGLLGVIFLLLTIYAGFIWMTAQGNEEKVEKAIGILKTGIIGMIVTLAAYSIANFVVGEVSDATA